MGSTEDDSLLGGKAEIFQLMFGFSSSMVLKCAVELGIADIINSHGHPITLTQLASGFDSPWVDVAYLARIMKFLVCKGIFTVHHPSNGLEILYGLNQNSRWLLRDSELSLAPMVLMESHPYLLAPWQYLSECVKGGSAFKKAHGCEAGEFAARNPEFNRIVSEAMALAAKSVMKGFLLEHKGGFDQIGSMVDVGGSVGADLAEIIKVYPHINSINFDLPHVIALAPKRNGVSHVDGNMFEAIPNADAILLKWMLHDWGDEDCIKILQNCRKAIPEKTGKIILVETIMQPDKSNQFDDTIMLALDLMMLVNTSGGRKRTEVELKKLLEKGGFPRCRIIKIPAISSIIEAYPQ